MEFLFGWIFASVVLFVICFAFWLLSRAPYDQVLLSASSSTSSASERPEHPRETANPDLTASDKKKTHFKFRAPLKGSSSYTHPWLAGSLKGHLSRVLDFDLSPNGKHLMTCSEDRSLILWNCSDFLEREHKCFRLNLDLDHALKVCFAPDSKSLLLCMAFDNTLTVYKLAKKESHAFRIEQVENVQFEKVHKADIIAIGISPDAKYIISASGDTSLAVWDLKGKILKMVNTNHGNNYYACISPCSRFIGTSGFTPDVKVWQVLFSKNGEFQDVTRAFELKVRCVVFCCM
ncbi:unnamed protein product [Soboliphyme baturini]|uniref:WD_REPEATS_REGION domain-containing protein n=1 Tax=Soboliphyme baturini TaxID=241478 RepID=A0A183IXM3_9BILA|nr:unnamed protein product [Soboliphyme baturini]